VESWKTAGRRPREGRPSNRHPVYGAPISAPVPSRSPRGKVPRPPPLNPHPTPGQTLPKSRFLSGAAQLTRPTGRMPPAALVSKQTWQTQKDTHQSVNLRLKALAGDRIRYGYRRLHVLLRCEGWRVNHKRVYRQDSCRGSGTHSKIRQQDLWREGWWKVAPASSLLGYWSRT